MSLDQIGRLIMLVGMTLLVLGGALVLFSRVPVLRDLGHLPGDIHLEGKQFTCSFPIVTMLILSLVLSLVLNIILRLFNR